MPKWLQNIYIPKQLKFLLNHNFAQKKLAQLVENFKPELVITQKPPVPSGQFENIPTIAFIRDLEYISFFTHANHPTLKGKLNYFIEQRIGEKILKELRRMNLVIANSDFVARQLKKHGIDAEVVFPFIDISEFVAEKRQSKYIAYISGSFVPHKGFTLFLDIARLMPDYPFLAVGRDPDGLLKEAPANVKHIDWTNDMRNIYSMTKLLLVPSLWEEPFCRMSIEAQANGIPVIASATGGLPESVGDAGILIDDFANPHDWVQSIKEIILSDSLMMQLSEKSRIHSKSFDISHSFSHFQALIDKNLGLQI